jgi:HEAT repeat protein
MPRRDPSEQAVARLEAVRANPRAEASLLELRGAVASKSGYVVARAAQIVREARLPELCDALVAAFERFMHEPAKSDPACLAKAAIARALYELEAREEQLFLRGIRHIQPEGTWGGTTDTAAELRGTCALALVRCNYRDVMSELADLLVDAEPSARLMAARAVVYSENAGVGAPLLRMKILAGDRSPEVTGECLVGLLKLSPRKSIPFAARLLDSEDEELRDSAILALGESRQPEALDLLKQRYSEALGAARRRPLLMGIALTRLPPAIEFLIEVIAAADVAVATAAIEAMSIYRGDEKLWSRVQVTVGARNEPELRRLS